MSRYIDANEAKRQINRATIGRTDVIKVCLDLLYRIDRIPTADVRENVKGEWNKNDNGTYSCSVCQSWIPEEQHCYARYCLYCGAEMKN